MKNRAIKLVISICVISCLIVGFCTAFASAEPAWLIRAKAGIAAAMLASNLVINPVNYALDDALAEGIDPAGYVLSIQQSPWESYLDQSVIKVNPDSVIIDGVSYSDIWLGPEAADSLRLAGLDFASAYNILSNQSTAITYASGIGYVNGAPMYRTGGQYNFSEFVHTNWPSNLSVGNANITYEVFPYAVNHYRAIVDGVNGSAYPAGSRYFYYCMINGASYATLNQAENTGGSGMQVTSTQYPFQSSPFSFDYTSGVIDDPIDPEDGLLLRIPSEYTSQSSPQYNYDIHDLINVYPTITQPGGKEINVDPALNPDYQTDVDLGNDIGDLIRTILTLLDVLDNIDIEFAPEPESPEPPPEPGQIDPLPDPDPAPEDPVSGTTIADTDWTKLDEILRWIQSTIDSIRHITESLQTMLDSLFDQLQDIIQALQELPEQLLEDIETGPSKVFRKALDILKSLFLPLLLPIKALMNLWHYVVEWIQSITGPFTWIFGVMSGMSYNMVLPIYAVLAGSICIAIYKALGR